MNSLERILRSELNRFLLLLYSVQETVYKPEVGADGMHLPPDSKIKEKIFKICKKFSTLALWLNKIFLMDLSSKSMLVQKECKKNKQKLHFLIWYTMYTMSA